MARCEVLFKYVEKETEKGDVRLFSFIGRDVNHVFVDGLARAGRGFSQIVSDAREGMESKVARMLRGGLSAHVVNYRLEWEGKPGAEQWINSSSPAFSRFSLFDSHANTDSPLAFSDSPEFTIPGVSQAPYKIQPLFPFSRSTVYMVLSSDAPPPSHVRLRGTLPEGDELELEIAVQDAVPVQGETIHQLAARKILQELKDGTSYVHGAVDKERQPALLAKWVKKEGVRVGLTYGVASHWTSFVAVERKEEVVEQMEEVEEREEDQGVMNVSPPSALDNVVEVERVSNDGSDNGMHRRSPGGPPAARFGPQAAGQDGGAAAVPGMVMTALAPSLLHKSDSFDSLNSNGDSFFSQRTGSVQSVHAHSSNLSPLIGNDEGKSDTKQFKRSFWSTLNRSTSNRVLPNSQSNSAQANSVQPSVQSPSGFHFHGAAPTYRLPSEIPLSPQYNAGVWDLSETFNNTPLGMYSDINSIDISYLPGPSTASAPPPDRLSADTGAQPLSSRTKALIDLQTFEGCFVLDLALATLLGVSLLDLARLIWSAPAILGLSPEHRKKVWATVLVIQLFETQLAGEQSMWQLVVDKAKLWMRLAGVGFEDIAQLKKMAGEVLGA